MKKVIQIGFVLAIILSPVVSEAKMVTIYVKGMVCGFCAQGIEKKFKAFPEVKKVHVSLEEKQVHLDVDDTKDLDDEKIISSIKDAGYNTEKIERVK